MESYGLWMNMAIPSNGYGKRTRREMELQAVVVEEEENPIKIINNLTAAAQASTQSG